MIPTRTDLFNYHVICETFTNPLNGMVKRGKMLLDGDLHIAQFEEDEPRRRYHRSRHIYGSMQDGVLLMQRWDGSYRLTFDFVWSGQKTFHLLQNICGQIYKVLKQSL